MRHEMIALNLILATAALERVGDARSKVLAAYASIDFASNEAMLEFFGYVAGLANDGPKAAREALRALSESVRLRVHAPPPSGFRRKDRESLDELADDDAAISCSVAIVYDLGEGPGLGVHLLPSFPGKAKKISDFKRFPWTCTNAEYEHVIAYSEIVAKHRRLEGKDLDDLLAWARDALVVGCYRKVPENMSERTLEAIVEIAFAHTEWPGWREPWTRELFRVRSALAEARTARGRAADVGTTRDPSGD